MGFTNTWDNSFPPDTQPANQLGSDIRNLKIDIQERMAAISGDDADKPTLEAGFKNLLYFALDVKKVYQWSGSAWDDVTSDLLPVPTTDNTMKALTFSATPTYDAGSLSNIRAVFQMTLSANVTSGTLVNIVKGQEITFIIIQDGTGGHSFVFPGGVNGAGDIDTSAGAINTQTFVVSNDGANLYPVGPMTVS